MGAPLASEQEIAELIEAIEQDEESGTRTVETLLTGYPDDPRLHFMKGSLLAQGGRAIEAHRAMSRAVELDQGYSLARYQLGLFEISSGEPARALSTWAPLLALGPDDCLRRFVEGMVHLIRDEFAPAIEKFELGIVLNRKNEPMNRDIRLLIEQCKTLQQASAPTAEDEHSATSLFLNRLGGSRTIQ